MDALEAGKRMGCGLAFGRRDGLGARRRQGRCDGGECRGPSEVANQAGPRVTVGEVLDLMECERDLPRHIQQGKREPGPAPVRGIGA